VFVTGGMLDMDAEAGGHYSWLGPWQPSGDPLSWGPQRHTTALFMRQSDKRDKGRLQNYRHTEPCFSCF